MTRFPDEEPDVDESDEPWFDREDRHANGHCRRCGIKGHHENKCPTITPLLLRRDA